MKIILESKNEKIEIENKAYLKMSQNYLVAALGLLLSYVLIFGQAMNAFETNYSFGDILKSADLYTLLIYGVLLFFVLNLIGVSIYYYIKHRSTIKIDLNVSNTIYFKKRGADPYTGLLTSLYQYSRYKLLYIGEKRVSVSESAFVEIESFFTKTGNQSHLQKMTFKTETKKEFQEFKESLIFFNRKKKDDLTK